MSLEMNEAASYPTPKAPPPGLNPGSNLNPAEGAPPITYPPSSVPAYPPPAGYPPGWEVYPPGSPSPTNNVSPTAPNAPPYAPPPDVPHYAPPPDVPPNAPPPDVPPYAPPPDVPPNAPPPDVPPYAPPPGLNPAIYPNTADGAPPIICPPNPVPGYPLPAEVENPPGYSLHASNGPQNESKETRGNAPSATDSSQVHCDLQPTSQSLQAPITNPPASGRGYPLPGTNYAQPGIQPLPISLRGLEYLTMVDQLIVHQQIEVPEVALGVETSNKYVVKNSMGQKIYFAREDTDCCTLCLGESRPFDMRIEDNTGHEVCHFYRPCACGCPCCPEEMEVTTSFEGVIGTIEQEWNLIYPRFLIKNAALETELRIEGPLCTTSFGRDVEFKVMSKDGETEVGCIRKQWSGLLREAFTDADHFGITFPIDLDVKMKATLLGVCMLIDFMYYEKSG